VISFVVSVESMSVEERVFHLRKELHPTAVDDLLVDTDEEDEEEGQCLFSDKYSLSWASSSNRIRSVKESDF
jgi:hypothetical protein